jgi:hypothetical protein
MRNLRAALLAMLFAAPLHPYFWAAWQLWGCGTGDETH